MTSNPTWAKLSALGKALTPPPRKSLTAKVYALTTFAACVAALHYFGDLGALAIFIVTAGSTTVVVGGAMTLRARLTPAPQASTTAQAQAAQAMLDELVTAAGLTISVQLDIVPGDAPRPDIVGQPSG